MMKKLFFFLLFMGISVQAYMGYGGIHQLRGQEEGEGGSLEYPRILANSESILYYCLLCTVMGG